MSFFPTTVQQKKDYHDIHHIQPKNKGGTSEESNLTKLTPQEHMKLHGNWRERSPWLEELKSLVDSRQQLIKTINGIGSRLRAFNRGTDVLRQRTVGFLQIETKRIMAERAGLEKLLVRKLKEPFVMRPFVDAILGVPAVGPITVAYCLAYVDLEKDRHASSVWKYAGLHCASHERYKKGQKGGGNTALRSVLYMMAESQIKWHGPYRTVYDSVKERLSKSEKMTKTRIKGGRIVEKPWKEVSKGHRHGAALRAVMKHFLADYWYVGRTMMGLPTSPCYAEAVLGSGHRTIMPEERGWKY